MTLSARAATVVAVVVAAAGLAGCGSTGTPSGSASSPGSTSAAAATSAAPPTKAALPVGGKCALLTTDQAASLLGSTPKGSAANVSPGNIIHVDGCTYVATAANLGYDINDYSATGITAAFFVQQAQAATAKIPDAQKFDAPGGDASVAFAMAAGARTMARIEVAKGKYVISVNALAGDPAKAKQIALGALAILLAAVAGG